MGEGQETEVSDETGQESPTQNECGGEGKNSGGSQGAMEEGQSRREEDAVRHDLLNWLPVAVAQF